MTTHPADVDDVCAAVAAFDLGGLLASPEAVAQAWSNGVYRVDTTTGVFAIKLFAPTQSPSQAQSQARRLRRGTAFEQLIIRAAEIPVPAPVECDGEWIVHLASGTEPRLARCHRWVDGEPARRPLGLELLVQAGTYLARMHSTYHPDGDTSQLPSLEIQRWNDAVAASLRLGLSFSARLADLAPVVRRLGEDLEDLRRQRRPMQTSHGDYDPKNMVVTRAGQLVVTDWDYAGPVVAGVELLVAATSFASSDDEVLTFVQAYRDAGGQAVVADSLAMSAELADLDWLLRNVEAFIDPGRGDVSADADAVEELVAGLPAEVSRLQSWSARLGPAGEADEVRRSTGRA